MSWFTRRSTSCKPTRVICPDCNLTLSDLGDTSSEDDTCSEILGKNVLPLNNTNSNVDWINKDDISLGKRVIQKTEVPKQKILADLLKHKPLTPLVEHLSSNEHVQNESLSIETAVKSNLYENENLNNLAEDGCYDSNFHTEDSSCDSDIAKIVSEIDIKEEKFDISLCSVENSSQKLFHKSFNELECHDSFIVNNVVSASTEENKNLIGTIRECSVRLERLSEDVLKKYGINQRGPNEFTVPGDHDLNIENKSSEISLGNTGLQQNFVNNNPPLRVPEAQYLDESQNSAMIYNNCRITTPRKKILDNSLENSQCKSINSNNAHDYNLRERKSNIECLPSRMSTSKHSIIDMEEFSDIDRTQNSDQFEDIPTSQFFSNETCEIDVSKINERIKEFNEAANKFLSKAKKMHIPINWNIPEAHKAKKGIWKSKGDDVTKGKLTDEEINYLHKRLRKFIKKHKLDSESLKVISGNQPFRCKIPNDLWLKLIQYLSKDLTDRTPLAVYSYIKRLGLRKGPFSPDEDTFLIEMHNNYTGPNFNALCGLMLNRHRFNIYRRIQRLKDKNVLGSKPQMGTTKEQSPILKGKNDHIINEILYRSKGNDLKTLCTKFSSNVWTAIGNKHNISPALVKGVYLCELWPCAVADHPIYYHKCCLKLIRSLHEKEYGTWGDIKWQKLSREIYNLTPAFLYLLLRKLVMQHVPRGKWRNFRGCIEQLFTELLPEFEKVGTQEDHVMKRIQFCD